MGAVAKVHVRLIGEGIAVSRPVEAIKMSSDTFKIVEPEDRDMEEWEFHSGTIVRCETRLSEGEVYLLAVEKISD